MQPGKPGCFGMPVNTKNAEILFSHGLIFPPLHSYLLALINLQGMCLPQPRAEIKRGAGTGA